MGGYSLDGGFAVGDSRLYRAMCSPEQWKEAS